MGTIIREGIPIFQLLILFEYQFLHFQYLLIGNETLKLLFKVPNTNKKIRYFE
jgi:hypothetical protein